MMELEQRHLDTLYETMSALNVVAHIITSEGMETDLTGDASFILTESRKRLGKVVGALERLRVEVNKVEIIPMFRQSA